MKGRPRAVLREMILSPTVRTWPLFGVPLCVGSGHGFIPQFCMAQVPTEVWVRRSECAELAIILEPSF